MDLTQFVETFALLIIPLVGVVGLAGVEEPGRSSGSVRFHHAGL